MKDSWKFISNPYKVAGYKAATRKKPLACLTAPSAVWRIPCGAPSCALLAWC